MTTEATMPRETVAADMREATSNMVREIAAIVTVAEIAVMAKAIKGAKAEVERVIAWIVIVPGVSVVGVGSRTVTRRRRARGKDKPGTQQER
jgi:hypothetical protein